MAALGDEATSLEEDAYFMFWLNCFVLFFISVVNFFVVDC